MNKREFLSIRNNLEKQKKEWIKRIDKQYSGYERKFLATVCPVDRLKVYEVVKDGIKRKGFSRFVIYARNVQMIGKHCTIRVGGWWLNENNVPTKWDSMIVYGLGNPAILKLSDNQKAEKHPEATE